MTIEGKINLLLRMQICNMDDDGVFCSGCSYAKHGMVCREALLSDAVVALRESHQEAESTIVSNVVADLLTELGVPVKDNAYQLLVDGITFLIENPNESYPMSQKLYGYLAERFGINWHAVERGIRRSIERAFDRCDPGVIEKYFGNTIHPDKGIPTSKEFIMQVANLARRRIGGADHG